jgi:hypothetical protein
MSTSYSHLPEATAKLIELSTVERVRSVLADRYIHHERVTDLIKHVEFRMQQPHGVRPTGTIVWSPSNGGKTALAEALVRRHRAREATSRHPAGMPIVMITMSGAREAKEIYIRFLYALGMPHLSALTGSECRLMALKLGEAADLILLIVDEIQDVLLSTQRQQQLALLAIKDIMNSLKVHVLALGTEDARHALEVDQHLKRRFQFRELPSWRNDDYLRHFLEAYESTLPLKQRSNLGSPRMMKVLIKESEGVLGAIVDRLKYAAALAIETEMERITIELIERARFDVPITDLSSDREEAQKAEGVA